MTVGSRLRRRSITIPAVCAVAGVSTILIPVWLPAAVAIDLIRLRWRLSMARLGAFGVCWAWLEVAGVAWAGLTWVAGLSRNRKTQYALMRWWAAALMSALRMTTGIAPRVEGREALERGQAIVLCRHVSLADSLLSAWAIRCEADLWPRYVLKRELLFDPCLDVVGLRLPNHFLDRSAGDDARQRSALRALTAGLGKQEVAVIFPEGTRSNDAKRARALKRIAHTDPQRAEHLSALQRLLPPRPAGSMELLAGAPDADLVLAWHTGFDGLDTFGGIVRHLARPLPPVRFVTRRVARSQVPEGEAFGPWLDRQWIEMDTVVDAALAVDR